MKKLALLAALSLLAAPALAETKSFDLTIKDHTFEPATLDIPAGEKIKLVVKNLDATPEEFESHDLKREKVIAGGAQAVILVGPLKAGEYKFFGEYHEDTAKGTLIAK